MTPEAQRIAIAEACGITEIGSMGGTLTGIVDNTFYPIPNYLSDLNAMHEAEKVLKGKEWEWVQIVAEMLNMSNAEYDYDIARWRYARLTAAQRAEAFLRTIGKWEGE